MENKKRKFGKGKALVFTVLFATLAFVSINIGCASAAIYVPGDYVKIQWGIDNATAGETIIVNASSGPFYENVVVNKKLKLRGIGMPIVDSKKEGDVIRIIADGCTLDGFKVINSGTNWEDSGIKVESDNNLIENNIASNNYLGIYLGFSSNNSLIRNNASSNDYVGISLDVSFNNTLISNNALNGCYGIRLDGSSDNTLMNNHASDNWNGFSIDYSSDNTLVENNASNNDVGIMVRGYEKSQYDHSIDTSNIVNGEPVYYFYDIHDQTISGLDTTHLTVAASENVTIRDNNIGNGDGIKLAFVSDSIISNNIASNNWHGINLEYSSNNVLTSNTMNNSNSRNFRVMEYFDNSVDTSNTVNGKPVYYFYNIHDKVISGLDTTHLTVAVSRNVTIKNNNISGGDGIEFSFVENSIISDTNLSLNGWWSIWIDRSSNNTIMGNNVNKGDIHVVNSINNVTLINNNISNGYIHLYDVSNSAIMNNSVSNSWHGIELVRSDNNNITENIVCYNEEGILLESSNNNTISNNTVYSNDEIGILLESSSYNQMYHNDLIDNKEQAYDDDESNSWDKGPVIGGNYWSDHTCIGNPSDGSQPYYIDADSIDHYPFENRIHNVTKPTERIYGIPVDFRFNDNLRKGNNDPEVRYLQIILNIDPDTLITTSGAGSPDNETTYFGSLTEKAVIKFQEKYAKDILEPLGLTSGTGFVGEKTRNKLNDILDQNFTEDYKKKFNLLNDTERKAAIWGYINKSYKDYGLPEDFPKELILAIATQETGEYAHWNNEHVADDWGRGIMQVTSEEYVGAGGVDSESEDCKKCKNREGKIYCSKYYSNTLKGIEANIKDGLYALSVKYQQVNKDKIQPPAGYTTQEIIWISTVQRYNTKKLHPTKYIKNIGDKLVKLGNGKYGQFDGFDTQDAKSLGEKFKKAYSESLKLYSPAEIRVYDDKGNVTGLVNGEVREEIPNSIYDNVTKTVMIVSSHDYYYDVVGKDTGTYGLNMVSVKNEKETDFSITNVSTTTNATHQYLINWTAYSQSEEGVTLKIDADGDGIFEETITIQPPIARFTYSPEDPAVNQAITFNASGSYDADGVITNYEWDFGDGNTTSTAEPIITHFYSLADDYDVILTVTDNDGATNSTNKTITIYPPTAIFDTGAPANPYPSIMGNHTGTIKPNHTIIATKLYTYPCSGTGGHSEYVRVYGNGIIVDATWNGYQGAGDYHYIVFSEPFTLEANVTYNYTIKTGSYPQNHHTDNLSTPAGFITCSEFVDANGKRYNDWIPAIRLE